jgi:hypothetical protein
MPQKGITRVNNLRDFGFMVLLGPLGLHSNIHRGWIFSQDLDRDPSSTNFAGTGNLTVTGNLSGFRKGLTKFKRGCALFSEILVLNPEITDFSESEEGIPSFSF